MRPPAAWLLPALLLAHPVLAREPGDPGGSSASGAPSLAFTPSPAAVLDPSSFAHSAPLVAHASAEGVSRLVLPPAILAVARVDLADVRVVDGSLRQWPYVLSPDVGHAPIDLRLVGKSADRGASLWRLVPPVAPVVLDSVTLRVDRDLFDRGFRLQEELAGGRTAALATGRLARAAGDPPEIRISLSSARVTELSLLIDDGDEAPLPLTTASAQARTAELALVAPAGAYTLLVGDPQASTPRYEIGHARAAVLAARAGSAELGTLGPNAAHRPRLPGGDAGDQIALWAVLALAVAALGVLTWRLSRKDSPDAAPSAKAPTPPDPRGPPNGQRPG